MNLVGELVLARNCLEHGIERPEVRVAAGKPAAGWLLLRAYHESGLVVIEIAADGAGINLARVREKAVEKGILKPDEASRLNDRQATDLMFLPGFSTAESTTSVSGRGVGMDVVKTNVENSGGSIELSSVLGAGTTLRLKIPPHARHRASALRRLRGRALRHRADQPARTHAARPLGGDGAGGGLRRPGLPAARQAAAAGLPPPRVATRRCKCRRLPAAVPRGNGSQRRRLEAAGKAARDHRCLAVRGPPLRPRGG